MPAVLFKIPSRFPDALLQKSSYTIHARTLSWRLACEARLDLASGPETTAQGNSRIQGSSDPRSQALIRTQWTLRLSVRYLNYYIWTLALMMLASLINHITSGAFRTSYWLFHSIWFIREVTDVMRAAVITLHERCLLIHRCLHAKCIQLRQEKNQSDPVLIEQGFSWIRKGWENICRAN